MNYVAFAVLVFGLGAGCADDRCTMKGGTYQLTATTVQGTCYYAPGSVAVHSDGTVQSLADDTCGSGCEPPPASCGFHWGYMDGNNIRISVSCDLVVDGDTGTGACSGHRIGMGYNDQCSESLTLTRTGP